MVLSSRLGSGSIFARFRNQSCAFPPDESPNSKEPPVRFAADCDLLLRWNWRQRGDRRGAQLREAQLTVVRSLNAPSPVKRGGVCRVSNAATPRKV